jgi:hypothetical protein
MYDKAQWCHETAVYDEAIRCYELIYVRLSTRQSTMVPETAVYDEAIRCYELIYVRLST